MKGSWRIGQLAGIEVRMHATFLLLLAWTALSAYSSSKNVLDMLSAVLFIVALFACVVLHELGHALMARRFGIATKDITLLPIGGLARLERMPEKPSEELAVAVAGPVVNVILFMGLYLGLRWGGGWQPVTQAVMVNGPLLVRLCVANLSLVIFNLLPAFPMDGGRMLRAILATRMGFPRATQTAAAVGQAIAAMLGLFGLFFNPLLVLIAVFIWVGASYEAGVVQAKSTFAGIQVHAAMMTNFTVLHPTDTLAEAAQRVIDGSQQDFPVMEGEHLAGVLTRNDLLIALAQQERDSPVAQVMRRTFSIAAELEPLENAFRRMQEAGEQTMPVLNGQRLVGMVTTENIAEYFLIQAALKSHPAKRLASKV